MHDYWFGEALGELRAGIGLQAGIIAARYKLDMEDDLAGRIAAAVQSRSCPRAGGSST
jgi:hypothetical protein